MIKIVYSNPFKKDFKKLRRLPLPDLKKIFEVISTLEQELSGNWSNFRECHIKPDLLLIYKASNNELQLARIGSHSELF